MTSEANSAKPGSSEVRPAAAGGRWFTVFLVISTVALCVLAVAMTRELRRTRARVAELEEALLRETTKDSLAVGERVTPLKVVDAGGDERMLDFTAHRATLVLLTSAHCPYCEETVPKWARVLERTQAGEDEGLQVVCLQADARTPGDLKALPPPLKAELAPEGNTSWPRRIPIAPGAVLINPEGVITKAWYGTPSDQDLAAMEAALLGAD